MAKENPLQRVAREMADNCEMSLEEIEAALTLLLDHLNERAARSINECSDDDAEIAVLHAQQYWAFAELVGQFGTALIAYDDVESDSDDGMSN